MIDYTTCEERKEFSASPFNTKGQGYGGQLLDAVQSQLHTKWTYFGEAFAIKCKHM